jgi:hypothetical protein
MKFTSLAKFVGILIVISIVAITCRYTHDAKETAFKEFKPSALLKKYEYYKDVSASLDKKIADVQVYDVRVKSLQDEYKGVKRTEWAREDREQLSIWMSEVAGIKASYNTLAAEYNSAMSKFNWAFCNVGTLPQGAANPLPKEYKPYITQ